MDYLLQARHAVERLHQCTAVHVETVPVRHSRGDQTIFEGDVEVFTLEGFKGADCCYVWGFRHKDEPGKFEFISVPAGKNLLTPTAAVLAVLEWEKKHGTMRERLVVPTPRKEIQGAGEPSGVSTGAGAVPVQVSALAGELSPPRTP